METNIAKGTCNLSDFYRCVRDFLYWSCYRVGPAPFPGSGKRQYHRGGREEDVYKRQILKRVPYKIIAKELDVPAYRNIGLALRSRKTASLAVKRFIEYLEYR